MKRLLTLAAALMALMMVLSLSACGETAEETGEEPTVETTAPAAPVDLAALREQLLTDCGISDFVNVETDALANLYGIDAAGVVGAAGFSASSGVAFPQEIVMVQAVDDAAAADIAAKLGNRLSAIAEQAASYDPASLELAENCAVVTNGTFVGMFFSEHYDAMVSAFQNALGCVCDEM